MPVDPYWRRWRRQFSISAPRMAVRTHLGWPWRVALGLALLAVIAGMWWWGFDFGQFFGGERRQRVETQLAALSASAEAATREASELRTENSRLASDLAMTRGMQASLARQSADLAQENAQLKEEVAFLQQLVADTSREPGIAMPRLVAQREGQDMVRFSLLLVRGGNPKDEFDGRVALQALLATADDAAEPRSVTVLLPDEQPDTDAVLKLRFKYYQRVEGAFRVPPGAKLRSLIARAYETGSPAPRVTRTLTIP